MPYNTLLIVIGTGLLGACAGLVGSFTVLRNRALAGDALAHAALPGVCVAFLIGQRQTLPILLAGALVSGLLGVTAMTAIRRLTRIREDAATGIVLSVFYGCGVVLLVYILRHPQEGNPAGLRSFLLGKTAGMSITDVKFIAAASIACLAGVLLLYKEFLLVSFDAGFAQVQGWPAFAIDLLLMSLVALTVMIALPAVGVVLTAAILILPAAAARFWTDRLRLLLAIAATFGLVIGAGGAILSAEVRQPTGPIIVLFGTAIFVTSLLFAPTKGWLSRFRRERAARRRLAEQSTLQALAEAAATLNSAVDLSRLPSDHPLLRPGVSAALSRLTAESLAERLPEGYRLTDTGRTRAERLYEADRRFAAFLETHAELAGEYATLDREELLARLPQ